MPGTHDQNGLSLRESLFCAYYIVHKGCGAKAAEAAGYSGDLPKRACLLLKTPRVMQVIDRERKRLLDKLEVKKERVLSELARVAFADVRELFNIDGSLKNPHELDADCAAAISSIEVRHGTTKIRFNSKINALDLLGRFLKLWDGSGNSTKDRLQELLEAFKAGPIERKDTIQ